MRQKKIRCYWWIMYINNMNKTIKKSLVSVFYWKVQEVGLDKFHFTAYFLLNFWIQNTQNSSKNIQIWIQRMSGQNWPLLYLTRPRNFHSAHQHFWSSVFGGIFDESPWHGKTGKTSNALIFSFSTLISIGNVKKAQIIQLMSKFRWPSKNYDKISKSFHLNLHHCKINKNISQKYLFESYEIYLGTFG